MNSACKPIGLFVICLQTYRVSERNTLICARGLWPVRCCAVADLLVDASGPTTIKPNSAMPLEAARAPRHNNTGCETENKEISLSRHSAHTEFPPCLLPFRRLRQTKIIMLSWARSERRREAAHFFSLHFCRIIPTASGVAAFKDKCTHEKKPRGRKTRRDTLRNES